MSRSSRLVALASVVALALALALAGCVPSLSPLYTEKDLVVDPALVGTWVDGDEPTVSWTFEATEGKGYRLVIRGKENEKEKEGLFVAHLVSLRGHRFLDLLPDPASLEATSLADVYKWTLVPAHLFLRVDEIGTGFQFALLDADWVSKLLKRKPRAIDHRTVGDDGLVLTASTRELQKFALACVDTKGAFGDPSRLERQASAR